MSYICPSCARNLDEMDANEERSISLDDARVVMGMWDVCCSEGIGPDFEPLKQRFGRLYPELKTEYPYHYWEE